MAKSCNWEVIDKDPCKGSLKWTRTIEIEILLVLVCIYFGLGPSTGKGCSSIRVSMKNTRYLVLLLHMELLYVYWGGGWGGYFFILISENEGEKSFNQLLKWLFIEDRGVLILLYSKSKTNKSMILFRLTFDCMPIPFALSIHFQRMNSTNHQ